MGKPLLPILLALAALAGCARTAPTATVRGTAAPTTFAASDPAARHLAVKLRGRALPGVLRDGGTRVVARLPQIGWVIVDAGSNPTRTQAALDADPAVAEAHPLTPALPEGEPDDPRLPEQYNLPRTHVPAAWATTQGQGVKLAIIDTGVDMKHPDLAPKLDPASWNVFDHTTVPHDHYGHGTHTAGIAAAVTGNAEGIAGVAPQAGLLVVKCLANGDQKGSDATVAEAVLYAADHGAQVMSLSLGFYKRSKVLEAALDYALAKDVVVVASAGNQNEENDATKAPHLPSTHPGVIEVAATDAADAKAKFSNFGKTVSVSAPGVDVLSALPLYPEAWTIEMGYGKLSGTSMAAPLVAGVAALVRARFPGLDAAGVKKQLEATADDLGAPGFDPIFGHGRVNAARAVAAAR